MENTTRTRMWRLQQLDQQIKSGRYPNCTSFAKYLAEMNGMNRPYDRKTIQRDIEFLRDQMNAPIEYNFERRGYCYTDNTWSFSGFKLSEGELLQLLVSEQMAKMFEGTPLSKTLNSLFEKINATLTEAVYVDPIITRKQFSFHGHPVRPVNPLVWERIFSAMHKSQVIFMSYKGIHKPMAEKREVEPLHLANVDGDWYLVAFCLSKKDFRHFAVSRIASVAVKEQEFEPKEFNPEEYFANRFGRFIGQPDEAEVVKIKFAASAASWILEREWHSKQNIQKHRDGSLTLSFPVPSLYEALRWVLQWGSEAEVMGPEALKLAVREEIKLMRTKLLPK